LNTQKTELEKVLQIYIDIFQVYDTSFTKDSMVLPATDITVTAMFLKYKNIKMRLSILEAMTSKVKTEIKILVGATKIPYESIYKYKLFLLTKLDSQYLYKNDDDRMNRFFQIFLYDIRLFCLEHAHASEDIYEEQVGLFHGNTSDESTNMLTIRTKDSLVRHFAKTMNDINTLSIDPFPTYIENMYKCVDDAFYQDEGMFDDYTLMPYQFTDLAFMSLFTENIKVALEIKDMMVGVQQEGGSDGQTTDASIWDVFNNLIALDQVGNTNTDKRKLLASFMKVKQDTIIQLIKEKHGEWKPITEVETNVYNILYKHLPVVKEQTSEYGGGISKESGLRKKIVPRKRKVCFTEALPL